MNEKKILLVSFDWRNIFDTAFLELKEKLERDRLCPAVNNFFIFSWSTVNYHKKVGTIETEHKKTIWRHFRPMIDVLSVFYIPFSVYRYTFIPDAAIVRDFPLLLSTIYFKLFTKAKIILFITNLPTDLVKTRRYKSILFVYYRFFEWIGRYLVDEVCVINSTTKEYVLNVGIEEKNIHVFAPNTIVRDEEYIKKSVTGVIRARYNISHDEKIILSVGRLENEKGFKDLIELFAIIPDKKTKLIIVGQGSKEEELKTYATELGLDDRVIFAGLISRAEIWDFYKDADIFMLLSHSEALGLVFWEAMYMKVPVIGRDTGGITESIGVEEERGYLWHKGENKDVVVQKIMQCLKKENVADKVERAYAYVIDQIAHEKNINDII